MRNIILAGGLAQIDEATRNGQPQGLSGMRNIILAGGLALGTDGCLQGNGVSATREYDVAGATSVTHKSFIGLEVRRILPLEQESHALEASIQTAHLSLTCDENLLDSFKVRLRTQTVTIDNDGGIQPRVACRGILFLPTLLALTGEGSGALTVLDRFEGLALVQARGSGGVHFVEVAQSEDGLRVESTGSGAVTFSKLETPQLEVRSQGSGRVRIAGQASAVSLVASGSGGVSASGLIADRAGVRSTGSGSVGLTVTESIRVRLNGSGGVTIYGNPSLRDIDDSGSGQVRFQ